MDDIKDTLNEIDRFTLARSIECDYCNLSKYKQVNRSDLTIISQNIRSIYCNFDDFIVNLSSLSFDVDVIALTECRLTPNKSLPQLRNYYLYATTSQLNQNDGVVVYVKNTLKSNVKEIRLSQASCLEVELLNNIIVCVYRSPSNTNAESFINSLNMYLETIKSKNIIITGDININLITYILRKCFTKFSLGNKLDGSFGKILV